MSEDRVDPTKIPFGTLNDVSEAIGGRRQKASQGDDFLTLVANAAMVQLMPDTLIGTGPYKAIVLRVESDNQTPEPGSWLANTFGEFFGSPPELVKIKARIPELHPALPIPDQLGSAEGPHQPIIDLYPTFVAEYGPMEAPSPGDIVNVDFGNKNTYADPIYLGPLFKTTNEGGGVGPLGGANIFGNCGASNPIPATPAPQPSPPTGPVGTATEDSENFAPGGGFFDITNRAVFARPPSFLAGLPVTEVITPEIATKYAELLKNKDESKYPVGTVYIFGDSQTNGMSKAILEYFSGFNVNYNNWYGGTYRIASKKVPEDKVKGENQGKPIDSYDYKAGDTVIIGSIGGNMSFAARDKYPVVGTLLTADPYLVDLPAELPTDGIVNPATGLPEYALDPNGGTGTASLISTKYGLGRLIQDDPDHGNSFIKFCDVLNDLKSRGVNIIIFGLPYGGNASRQEDRVHFDYVQFASLASKGLGMNYVSVMETSKVLKAGVDDVHYFKGNGGQGYKDYFNALLKPYTDSYYFLYRQEIKDILGYAQANEPVSDENLQLATSLISVPEGEEPNQSEIESLAKTFQSLDNEPDPEPVQPTTPSAPSTACIGTVGGATGYGGGGVTGGSASGGKKFSADPNPFNGGKQGEIIINGQAYPVSFPIVGSIQFRGLKRKGPPTFVVIHNSAGPGDGMAVAKYLRDVKEIGVHFTVDLDGTIMQHADPVTQIMYHGTGLNYDSIGIETPMKVFGPNSSTQAGAGFTLAKQGVWWSDWSAKKGFTKPPEVMVNAMNQLLATLSAKIPSITPFFKTLPDSFVGPPALNTRNKATGMKFYNKNGDWAYPKPNLDTIAGSMISHRDWVNKADGRYFLERFYEYYTGKKLGGIFRE